MNTTELLENIFDEMGSIEELDWDGIQLRIKTYEGLYQIEDMGGGEFRDLLHQLEKNLDNEFGPFEVTIKTY